jgi:predicted MFS family arabinose efflux permease
LWIDVLSFAGTFLSVWRLPAMKEAAANQLNTVKGVLKGMEEGLQFLLRDKLNLSLSLQAMVGNFGYTAAFAVLMYYLVDMLHLSPEQSSLNYTLIGVGGLLGTLIVVPLERRFRRGVLIAMLLTMGTLAFCVPMVSSFWLAPGIAFGFVTACNVAWNTLVMSTRQQTVPPDKLGRVLGFSRVFTRLAMPLGAMVGGFVSDLYGALSVFAVAALAKALEVVIALTSPIRKL